MIEQQIFVGLLVTICCYAICRGGTPERLSALSFLLATLLSVVSVPGPTRRFHHTEIRELIVDIGLLLIVSSIAMRSTRWWPLFVAGFQLDGVTVHLMRAAAPGVLPLAYLNGTALWSYPMIVILGLGTWRHQTRLRQVGEDPPWQANVSTNRPGRGIEDAATD